MRTIASRAPSAHPLPQRIVEPLDEIGLAAACGADLMPSFRDGARIGFSIVSVKAGLLAIDQQQSLPEFANACTSALADIEGNDLFTTDINGDLDSLLVRLATHKAPPLIGLSLHTLLGPTLMYEVSPMSMRHWIFLLTDITRCQRIQNILRQ